MRRAGWIAAACLVLAGCANLPPIQPACGNGVLEPGEDCDTPSGRCQSCGWTCGSGGDCSDIPAPRDGASYACGADGFCHAPAGVIGSETTSQPFFADSVFVTDVDGDQYGDAVGVSASTIATRFGDAAGMLANERDTLTPARGGDVALADVLGDGARGLLMPTRDGLVAYASAQGVMTPYGIAIEPPPPIQILEQAVVPIDGKRIALLVRDPFDSTHLSGGILDITSASVRVTDLPLCDSDFASAGFDASTVDYYQTQTLAGQPSVVISFVAANRTTHRQELCAVAITEDLTSSPITFTFDIAPPLDAPSSRVVLADLDGSGCPSGVISDGGPATMYRYLPLRGTRGQCFFSGMTKPLGTFDGSPTDRAVGRVRLDPEVPGVAPDALVMTGGIYGVRLADSSSATYYTTDEPVVAAASGDVDGDGRGDAILAGSGDTIDVLYRVGSPPDDPFLPVRLPTHAPPLDLTVGDFDGNQAADIAYVERGPDGDALMIAYGTADRPLPAAEVAGFGQVSSAFRVALPDSNDTSDRIDDLGIVEQRTDYSAVVGFHGTPDRTMIPYLNPPGVRPGFHAVTGGHFVAGGGYLDMLAIDTADAAAGRDRAELWRFAGQDPGAISVSVLGTISGTGVVEIPPQAGAPTIGVCNGDPDAAAYCVDRGKLVDWQATPTDLAIGIDPTKAQALVLDPSSLDFSQTPPAQLSSLVLTPLCPSAACLMAPGSRLRAAFAADLDGDGTNELVVAFDAPPDGSGPAGVIECSVAATGLTCRDLVAEAGLLAAGDCRDAVPARFAAASPAAQELAVLCGSTIERVFHAAGEPASELHAAALFTIPFAPADIQAIQAGDVTGDGVDDLLVIGTDAHGRALHVYRQLTSREVHP